MSNGVRSKISYKHLGDDYGETLSFGCAQDLKNMHEDITEYIFHTEEQSANTAQWDKWVDFLIGMKLPLSYAHCKVELTDMSFIKSGRHLLWLHALIRMVDEEEIGFKRYVETIYALRAHTRLAYLDNYQIMQLATFFENKITNDSSGYTHASLPSICNDELVCSSLLPIEDIGPRFEIYGQDLEIAGTSTRTVNMRRFKQIVEPYSTRSHEIELQLALRLVGYDVNTNAFMNNLDANLDKIFEYLEKAKPYNKPITAICTNIGKNSTLIKGNVYLIKDTSLHNKRLVTVVDSWDRQITSRHFKRID